MKSLLKKLSASVLPLLVFAVAGARADTSHVTDSITALSRMISSIQKDLHSKFGIDKIYIGGGSSLAILDHVTQGKPISYRDLDIFVVAGQKVTSELAEKIGRQLESDLIGTYSGKDLRPRPRGNPELNRKESAKYNAGYGFFWTKENEAVDLSIFHSEKDLRLNGIFNIDEVMIPLDYKTSLAKLVAKSRTGLPPLDDPDQGYESWKEKNPEVVHWAEVQRDPQLQAIRMIRSYAKLGVVKLPSEVTTKLAKLVESSGETQIFQVTRGLIKLLADPGAAEELKSLSKLGIFKGVSPALQKLVNSTNEAKLKLLIDDDKGNPYVEHTPTRAWVNLIEKLPARARAPWLRSLSEAEPQFFVENLHNLVRPLDASDPPLKIGYFTGEFAPFTKGHLGVATKGLTAGNLDLVFVIPTPFATNDPKTETFDPDEWKERLRFAQLGTKGQNSLIVWPPANDPEPGRLGQELGLVLSDLQTRILSADPLTHIAGGDSLHRILDRNLPIVDPRPRIIVQRPGVPVPDEMNSNNGVTVVKNPNSRAISATAAIQSAALGGVPDDLRPEVYDEMMLLPRYQEIMKEYRKKNREIKKLTKKQPVPDENTAIVVYMNHNPPGHYEGDALPVDGIALKLLKKVSALPHSKIKIDLDVNTPQWRIQQWRNWIYAHNDDYEIAFNTTWENSPHLPKQIHVVHSGIMNSAPDPWIDKLKAGEGIVVYESPDAPLSPIFPRENFKIIRIDERAFPSTPAACMREAIRGTR